MLRKSTVFFLSCLAFILGVAFYSFFFPVRRFFEPFNLYFLFLCFFVISFLSFLVPKTRLLAVAFLGGSFFILGLWRYAVSFPVINENHVGFYNGQELVLQGVIDDEPDIREKSVRYTIKTSNLKSQNSKFNLTNGKVLLIAKSFPEYQYGDEISFRCRLEKPEPVEDFDYAAYLSRYDIYSICRFPENIQTIGHHQGNKLIASLYFLKNEFVASVNRIFSEPQASYLGGILYGAKRSIPEDLKEAFRRTGTAHLVALSGYNISVVAGFITATLSWFWIPRRAAFPLATLAIIAFVLLTGAQASVVRAGLMGIIVLLAKNVGRFSRARNILTFSAAAMLLQNPKVLAFDAGFQLSFAATAGLLLLSPYFSEKFKFLTTWLNIREAASATFAAIIFTLPLLLYNFGSFSLIAPLANLLIVPFIPLTMALGFFAASLGMIFNPLGIFIGWFTWVPLSYEISIIKWLSRFPLFEQKIPLAVFLLMYMGIVMIYKFKIKNAKNKIIMPKADPPQADNVNLKF